jgi:hypothetical protein
MRLLDYEFWKDLAAVMSYATVGVSLIGQETFGKHYTLLIASAIFLIFVCVIQMILHKVARNK